MPSMEIAGYARLALRDTAGYAVVCFYFRNPGKFNATPGS